MILSSMSLCVALMSSPAVVPPSTMVALTSVQMRRPRGDGGGESSAIEECIDSTVRRYTRNVSECQQNFVRQLTKCSYQHNARKRAACTSFAYSEYQECTTWAQRNYREGLQKCATGGGEMEPCFDCPKDPCFDCVEDLE